MRILLDLDCVLADFVGGAAQLFGLDLPTLLSYWEPGLYPMNAALGKALAARDGSDPAPLSDEAFWSPINRNAQFWSGLQPLSWMSELVRRCRSEVGATNVHIISSPSWCETSYAGKVTWIKRVFGPKFTQFALTPHKEIFARGDVILIDDTEKNCVQFRSAGGRAILFPAHHNALHEYKHNPLDYVNAQF